MPLCRRVWAQQAAARKTLHCLLGRGNELEQQFTSDDPQILCLPNMMPDNEPNIRQTETEVAVQGRKVKGLFSNAITRPHLLSAIYRRVQTMMDIHSHTMTSFPGPLHLESGLFGLPRVHFLRGCKGVGKSYLMFLTAAHVLVRNRRARVVYIGDCSAWKKCDSIRKRELFLADKIAAAFVDSCVVQDMIDRWACERAMGGGMFEPSIVSLLGEIQAYCEQESLKLVLMLDKIDEVCGLDTASKEIMSIITYITEATQAVTLLAASDESMAKRLCAEFHASSTWIRTPYSSTEAILHVQNSGLHCVFSAWQLKKLLQLTWHHPGELDRICQMLKEFLLKHNKNSDEVFSRGVQTFVQMPFTDFVPEPFAAILEWAQSQHAEIAEAVLGVLLMNEHAVAYIDTNYMTIVPGNCESTCIYPSPQIAKGVVEKYCGASSIRSSVDTHLEQMRNVVYQTLL